MPNQGDILINYRHWEKSFWEETYREAFAKSVKEGRSQADILERISPKKLDKSPARFFADLDTAAKLEGHTTEEIEKQVIKSCKNKTALNSTLLPIYIRLRAVGYWHEDLAS